MKASGGTEHAHWKASVLGVPGAGSRDLGRPGKEAGA